MAFGDDGRGERERVVAAAYTKTCLFVLGTWLLVFLFKSVLRWILASLVKIRAAGRAGCGR